MRDYDEDPDYSPSRFENVPFPVPVRIAGVIWIVFGGLIVMGAALTLLTSLSRPQVPNAGAQTAGNVCQGLFQLLIGAAFLFVGVQTVKGTAKDTLGNAIGSIILGALNGGFGFVLVLGALALAGGGMAALAVVLGGISVLAGLGLITAGVLALVGRKEYRAWKQAQKRRGAQYRP